MPYPLLFDDHRHNSLLPLTWLRPVADLRVGITTIAEKWSRILHQPVGFASRSYLRKKYPLQIKDSNLLINGGLLPDENLIHAMRHVKKDIAIFWDSTFLFALLSEEKVENWLTFSDQKVFEATAQYSASTPQLIHYPYDIFRLNGNMIEYDFKAITSDRTSLDLSPTNTLIGPEKNLFIEPGAYLEGCIINTQSGPVYIGKNAEIMEGSLIRGPFAACENSSLKMGSKVYGPTTLGPYCKAGGELNNVVFQAYSNKAHDGFLGNAFIGEWCNIGADTNNSNLKNNYEEVKLWDYPTGTFRKTGLQFCGLIMGDHSKCGINTMFNTGTSIGVSANIFGAGFPRPFIPSFTWGGPLKNTTYKPEAAAKTAALMMTRRNVSFTNADQELFDYIFEKTAEYRTWEKSRKL